MAPSVRRTSRRLRSRPYSPLSRRFPPKPAANNRCETLTTNGKGNIMDQATYDRGLAKRRKVLGEDYVNRALASADDFNRDFQRIVTQYCWGEAWGDETLTPRERSILNLGMIAALGKMEEFQTHVRGALRNGLSPDEIRAVLTQIAVYCGIPVGVDCFRTAKPIIDAHQKG